MVILKVFVYVWNIPCLASFKKFKSYLNNFSESESHLIKMKSRDFHSFPCIYTLMSKCPAGCKISCFNFIFFNLWSRKEEDFLFIFVFFFFLSCIALKNKGQVHAVHQRMMRRAGQGGEGNSHTSKGKWRHCSWDIELIKFLAWISF